MKLKFTSIAILLHSLIYSQQIDIEYRDNASIVTADTKSGFFQTYQPENYPGASGWHFLIDARHGDPRYAMQLSSDFYNQNLWFRKINPDIPHQQWSKVLMENPSGYVPLGTAAIRFQDNTFFSVSPSNVPGSITSAVSMPQYGIIAPAVTGGAELWISGYKGIRMFTQGGTSPKFAITAGGDAALQGKLEAKEIKVTQSPTADFVFASNYALPKLEDVEKHIKDNKHLPEIASAKEMEKEGVNIGEFQIKLLQKIEELTLYSIEQNKQIKQQIDENQNQSEEIMRQREKISSLELENQQIRSLLERVERLEAQKTNRP